MGDKMFNEYKPRDHTPPEDPLGPVLLIATIGVILILAWGIFS